MSRIYYSLYDRLLHREALKRAFAKVRRAKGKPGVDGQSITDFEANLEEELDGLVHELRTKTYRPLPVKRVEISKPDGGTRNLGVPAVRDRVVQQAMLDILQPIFDPDFHPSSYGYRPGRSCQQAVAKATMFIRQYQRKWVVDMDLSKCFDRLDHDLILTSFRRRVRDGSILNLLKLFLESGVMIDGNWEATELGSPQGGVISPLICNVYLDAFDQEMKRRGHRIVRYADDILILCGSRTAANHARQVATQLLEETLRLKVNEEKTHVVHASRGVKFLSVIIDSQWIRIQAKKVTAFKTKVKRLTRRNSPVNLERVISDLNPLLQGFAIYFRMANCKGLFEALSSWIRHRLRAKQLALWKKPQRLHRRLRQLGYQGDFASIKMRSWRNAGCALSHWAMPNAWFEELGLYNLSSGETGVLPQVT